MDGLEGPSNEIVNAAPSNTSNIRAILLNIKKKGNRNYRKRKTPDRDTDSNDSSQDSDDLSAEENVEQSSHQTEMEIDQESNHEDMPLSVHAFRRFLSSMSDNDSDDTP